MTNLENLKINDLEGQIAQRFLLKLNRIFFDILQSYVRVFVFEDRKITVFDAHEEFNRPIVYILNYQYKVMSHGVIQELFGFPLLKLTVRIEYVKNWEETCEYDIHIRVRGLSIPLFLNDTLRDSFSAIQGMLKGTIEYRVKQHTRQELKLLSKHLGDTLEELTFGSKDVIRYKENGKEITLNISY